MGRSARVCAALTVAVLLAPVAAHADADEPPAPLTDTPLPVVGALTGESSPGGALHRFDEVLHGVWRTDGGTIAYFSLRHRPSAGDERALTSSALKLRGGTANLTSPPGFTETALASAETGELYPVLLDETTEICLCTNVAEMGLHDNDAADISDGWQLVYAVFPELPAEVSTVDVHVDGYGGILTGVPVQDGPLPQPQVDADQWVASGQGWPAPPPADEIARAAEARTLGAVWVLAERSGAADGSWMRSDSGDLRTLELATDVLFGVDEYTITAEADAVLDDIAAQIADLRHDRRAHRLPRLRRAQPDPLGAPGRSGRGGPRRPAAGGGVHRGGPRGDRTDREQQH